MTGGTNGCEFQVSVIDTGFNTVYSNLLDVDANNYPSGSTITGTDSSFCSTVTSSSGETGYVSATTVYTPSITRIPSSINLNLQRVFVGK